MEGRSPVGARSVEFVVSTDDPLHPTRALAMRASLISAWEVEPAQQTMTLLPGQKGEQRFRITARRKGESGRLLPEEISATAPLVAAYAGAASPGAGADGLVESSRDVLVTVPSDREPGIRRGSLLFRWRDGHSQTLSVCWEAAPGW